MKAEGTVGAPTCLYYDFLFPAMPKPDMLEIFKNLKLLFLSKSVYTVLFIPEMQNCYFLTSTYSTYSETMIILGSHHFSCFSYPFP
jgi:hypothetical protein